MKLNNVQLKEAVANAGMDFYRPSMTVLVPGEDYYGSSIRVEAKDVSEWGSTFDVGYYHIPDSVNDITMALLDAERGGFPKLILFIEKETRV